MADAEKKAEEACVKTLRSVVSEILVDVYESCGQNAADAARQMGMDVSTFKRIKDGKTGFNIDQLARMADRVGGPVEFFSLHPSFTRRTLDDPLARELRAVLGEKMMGQILDLARRSRALGFMGLALEVAVATIDALEKHSHKVGENPPSQK